MKLIRAFVAMAALTIGTSLSPAALIFESGPNTGLAPASTDRGLGHYIDVSTDTTLTQMGFMMQGSGTAKFMIWNGTHSNLLYSSTVNFDEEASSWVYSETFSYLLQAGNTYAVGFVVLTDPEVSWFLGYYTHSPANDPITGNGISSSGQTFAYYDYADPYYAGTIGVSTAFQLFDDQDAGAVPEPASFVIVGLGLGAIALYRRKALLTQKA